MNPGHAVACFTVDDVCYDGYSTEGHLERLLRFFGDYHITATFFVVPLVQGQRLDQRRRYVEILKRAIADGHEVGLHGLEHDRFEFGVPPEMILALPHEGPARERLAEHRKEIEESLQVRCLRERLRLGQDILEQGIGRKAAGFRAPALSTCENLFHALDAERFTYDSSRCLQEAGWDILNGIPVVPRAITRERFYSLQYPGALRTLPLTTDYTWYLGRDRYDITLDLAKHDFDACAAAGIPFTPVCHVSPIQEGEDDLGFDLYRALLAHAQKRSHDLGLCLRILTLSQACDEFSWPEGYVGPV